MYYSLQGYFDVRTSISGLTFDESTKKFSICEAGAAGIELIAIHDLDGSIMGSKGYIVSNTDQMTAFEPGCYNDADSCSAFCPNAIFRTLTVATSNYIEDNVELAVTETNSDRTVYLPGVYMDPLMEDNDTFDVDLHRFARRKRYYFATLPFKDNNDYVATFVKDSVDYWPLFAETQPEAQTGLENATSLTIEFIPPSRVDCSEVVDNGNVDSGLTNWWVTDGKVDTIEIPGSGQGAILKSYERTIRWSGVAQYLDTRCMIEGQEYTFTAKVQGLNKDGQVWVCDDLNQNCPRATLKAQNGIDAPYMERSNTRIGWYEEDETNSGWNLLRGTVTISAEIATAESVLLTINGVPTHVDLLVDDVSFRT